MALKSTDMIEKSCLECKKPFKTQYRNLLRGRGFFCSKLCSNKNIETCNKKRETHSKKFKNKTYRKFFKQLEHRAVMEKILDRKLTEKEVVHHKDGNKSNNSPENLELYASNGDHLREHLLKNTGKCIIPNCEMDQKRKNMCFKHYARVKNHGNPYILHTTKGIKYVEV
jgi:hypothetical protein